MSGDVQVVALGARTPVGLNAASTAAAIRAGLSRVRRWEAAGDDDDDDGHLVGADSVLGVEPAPALSRMIALARSAFREVLEPFTGAPGRDALRFEVFVGAPEPRPGFMTAQASQLGEALNAEARACAFEVSSQILPVGHAASLEAIRLARARLAANACSVAIVGGADSYLDADALDWLEEERRWRGKEIRNGFTPGEGAAFVALMRAQDAPRARLASLAVVRAASSARETKLIGGDEICSGDGLTAAVSSALASQPVDDVYCDINGERYRSEEWGFVALRLGSLFRDPAEYLSPARSVGDVGAASGALNVVLSARAWARGYAGGPQALVWGSSDSGLRAAVLLAAPPSRRS